MVSISIDNQARWSLPDRHVLKVLTHRLSLIRCNQPESRKPVPDFSNQMPGRKVEPM